LESQSEDNLNVRADDRAAKLEVPEARMLPSFPASDPTFEPAPLAEFVGREAALAQLQTWFSRALQGERQVVFVTGEAGIGKTTLVEAFLRQLSPSSQICTAVGQCLEQYGQGEAYLPVLEALGRICSSPQREWLVLQLTLFAPAWLTQLPALVNIADEEGLRQRMLGATRERMLREMAEVIEAMTAEIPLVLVLEDLHWSDYSTLDLISALARRSEPARFMLIGTYRPAELLLTGHPLKAVKQDLELRRNCQELKVDYLSQEAVTKYLANRFPGGQFSVDLAPLIHFHTDGHPLFMVNIVDYWLMRNWIRLEQSQWRLTVSMPQADVGVPESLRQMIEKQVDQLNQGEQRVLEAASIAGVDFACAAVAAALEEEEIHIEECCERLARRQHFLRLIGLSELPNRSTTTRFKFIHALYANILYQRVPSARRMRFHYRIAEKGEMAYGAQAGEIAGELALHFERSRNYRRAVGHLRKAADNDARRYANREAIGYLERAMTLVGQMREAEQAEPRMAVLEQLGLVRRSLGDMKQSAQAFEALACQARQSGQTEREVRALLYLTSVLFWVDREHCLKTVDQAVALSRNLQDELLQAHTRGYCGHWNLCLRGWRDRDAQACADAVEAAKRANDRALLSLHVVRYAYLQCLRSEYADAVKTAAEGQQLALEVSDAFDYLLSYFFSAWALLHLGQWSELPRILDQATAMAQRNRHVLWMMLFRLELAQLHLEALDFEGAISLCEPALGCARAAEQDTGQLLFHSLVVLGSAFLGQQQFDRAYDCFHEVNLCLQREERSMDWILHLPLHLGLSHYWLSRKNYDLAQQEAERLCQMAARPGERTYLALGWQMCAEISIAQGNWLEAESQIQNALTALKGGSVPLAEWKVYATAAKLSGRLKRRRHLDEYSVQCTGVIARLADSLSMAPNLRQQFLSRSSLLTNFRLTTKGA